MCGENCDPLVIRFVGRGSSPRVRGKQHGNRCTPPSTGLIPACAGKTYHHRNDSGRPRAHPRVCGENTRTCNLGIGRLGSSPRVRGKLSVDNGLAFPRRLIPACAGKTGRYTPPAWANRAHPRVCGENRTKSMRSIRASGSSPRVRGKPREGA